MRYECALGEFVVNSYRWPQDLIGCVIVSLLERLLTYGLFGCRLQNFFVKKFVKKV